MTKYKVSFVCRSENEGSQLLKQAKALGLQTCRLSRSADFDAFVSQNKIDLIHSHAGVSWEGHTGVYIAHNAGIPCIRTEHLPYLVTSTKQKREHKELLHLVSKLVCVSKGTAETFMAAGIYAEKLAVVRNGIDATPTETSRHAVRAGLRSERLPITDDAPVFLTVGRLSAQKNHLALINAIPAVLQQHPNAQWLFAGTGPLAKALHMILKQKSYRRHVHLLGHRSDVGELMAGADALVLPSLFEGLPLVVLEAMAAKLPVIASDVCGMSELIKDGETGRLVSVPNSRELATAMTGFINDPPAAERWSSAAYHEYLQQWTAQRMAKDMEKIYEEVLHQESINYTLDIAGRNREVQKLSA